MNSSIPLHTKNETSPCFRSSITLESRAACCRHPTRRGRSILSTQPCCKRCEEFSTITQSKIAWHSNTKRGYTSAKYRNAIYPVNLCVLRVKDLAKANQNAALVRSALVEARG